jgi:hypothetical protein
VRRSTVSGVLYGPQAMPVANSDSMTALRQKPPVARKQSLSGSI